MRVEKRNGYRVVIGGPVPPQAEAITLGKTIFVRKRSSSHQGLLAHELVHVRQFGRMGPARFLARYVGSYLRFRLSGYGHMAAYRRIPLEVEASWLSRLHPVCDLEPGTDHAGTDRAGTDQASAHGASKDEAFASAAAMRDRLQRQRSRLAASVRPTPRGGTWSRPRPPSNLTAVQAAMARRDANDSTSR